MKKTELIIIISNYGFSDEIVETSKNAGARGGTIIHGRGTATHETKKFFGINVQPEKDLILIVSQEDTKAAIMQAVSAKHGVHTEARAVTFTLPVEDAIGFNFEEK